ncbi:MAG: hypothetical protein LQ350_000546 [Teloschistes chrysophthalmus]|nr:MAG: hypothetical protein LQ350_000546 [Niorma chrysophthalma]
MADGFNEARALRVTELMTEYQSLLRRIAEYAPNPPPEEYFEHGYEVLRQCRAEAQAVLLVPYPIDLSSMPNGSGDQEKRQLQRYHRSPSKNWTALTKFRIIVDASARRFQAKKIYLRAVAAVRWSNARNAILQGTPHAAQATQQQQTNNNLRIELAAVTDARIINDFRQADTQAGYWLVDDPPLATILNWIRSQGSA